MILLIGGTGTLGRRVLARLTAAGQDVRVLTRHPPATPESSESSVETVVGDILDERTLGAAVSGCTAVVSAAHGFLGGHGRGPDAVDDRGNRNLVHVAAEAEIQHVVLLSGLGAGPDHAMPLHRAKYAAEQHVRASATAWTILRPAAYAETWADVVGAKLSTGGPALVLGRGTNPINFVSASDVAALVERALCDVTMRGLALDVPGPENLTLVELAHLLGATKLRHVPRAALRCMSVAGPLRPALARQARTALVMDTSDMTADASSLHRRFPGISWHHVADVVSRTSQLAP
jgi:uncharacterized protein YbjT (DUF2867 family)